MILTKSKCVEMVTAIETAAPGAFNYNNEEQYKLLIELFYDCFKEYSTPLLWQAVKLAILHCEYAKQNWIAAINNEIKVLMTTPEKSLLELWSELNSKLYTVYDLTQYLKYERTFKSASEKLTRIYDGLSDDIKLYVVNVSSLIAIAEETPEELNYEKGRFLKMMPELRKHKEERQQSVKFMALIDREIKRIGGGKRDV